jgi:hypothetical protein
MTGETPNPSCPRCGNKLLWNGHALACIACSYISTASKSEKRLPAARSRRRNKRDDESSGS